MRKLVLSAALIAPFALSCGPARNPLADPPEPINSQFVRFRFATYFSPQCTPVVGFSCDETFHLRADGRLEHYRGDLAGRAQVSRADLAAAVRVLTDPELLRLLDAPSLCISAIPGRMELDYAGRLRVDDTAGCRREAAVRAAREEMARLVAAYGI